MLLEMHDAAVAGRVAPFSACVGRGQMIHLLGPNGAGKSSLLARLSGLLPGSGDIQFLGQLLESWSGQQLARHRGWLHQQQLPPGMMAVYHYLQQYLHHADRPCDSALAQISGELQLDDKLARSLHLLSGGEWQRVRLAAVLLQIHPGVNSQGRLLLLDEPMAGLDVAQQVALDRLLAALCEAGITVIMSGHDLNHSLHHAQQVWLMQRGAMVAQGDAQQVLQPEILASVYGVPFRKLSVEGQQILTTLVD
ncbi:vitamin B12 ABC transporter ATP-binding protein BtuD [Erwinia sp. V71]|uniref:vitamin B12 ABC transporter ATP-binding protein BtuD n=1 Tax=Erwinia sp. V71 TaxID=3369424 RepID=UPI003F5FD791